MSHASPTFRVRCEAIDHRGLRGWHGIHGGNSSADRVPNSSGDHYHLRPAAPSSCDCVTGRSSSSIRSCPARNEPPHSPTNSCITTGVEVPTRRTCLLSGGRVYTEKNGASMSSSQADWSRCLTSRTSSRGCSTSDSASDLRRSASSSTSATRSQRWRSAHSKTVTVDMSPDRGART